MLKESNRILTIHNILPTDQYQLLQMDQVYKVTEASIRDGMEYFIRKIHGIHKLLLVHE